MRGDLVHGLPEICRPRVKTIEEADAEGQGSAAGT
jgi:hypothetical protein